MVKLNNAEQYEPIMVQLSETETPIAYKNKYDELIGQGMTDKEAREFLKQPIELEIYYEKDSGLFAVESGAVDSGCVYSPYSGELCEDADEY